MIHHIVFLAFLVLLINKILCKDPICLMADNYGLPCKDILHLKNPRNQKQNDRLLEAGYAEDLVFFADIKLDISGFHAKLKYNMLIDCLNSSSNSLENCDGVDVVIIQVLSSDVYVDPFEIRRSKLKGVQIFGDIDVEAGAWKANYSVLTVEFTGINCGTEKCSMQITIPVHARYQLASEEKFKEFEMNKISSMLKPQNQYIWKELKTEFKYSGAFKWRVPVGQIQHKNIVIFLTNTVLICGAISIVFATVVSKRKLPTQIKGD